MKVPIKDLSKAEIQKIASYRCSHGHTGLSHYNCYRNENKRPERIGFLDLECSNLKANFGIILSWCIKKANGEILFDVYTQADVKKGHLDKRIVKSCIEALRQFDVVVGHYSTWFDLPFLRTRAMMQGIEFPEYGTIIHRDTYTMAKKLLSLHSRRQDVIAEALQGKTEKTRLDSNHWILALQGNKKALAYVLHHNKADVRDLERNYNRLVPFFKKSNSSI